MKVIEETIGNTTVYFQAVETNIDVVGRTGMVRETTLTDASDRLEKAYAHAKDAIRAVVAETGALFDQMTPELRPSEVTVELAIGFSTSVGPIFVLNGSGEAGFTVSMTWSFAPDE